MQHDTDRRAVLKAAEAQGEALFAAIEEERLIRPLRTEREIEEDIYELEQRKFGVKKHWHKRIVRSGINTVTIASEKPPVREIEPHDVVYVDLGPVFGEWEADVGRTFVSFNGTDSNL